MTKAEARKKITAAKKALLKGAKGANERLNKAIENYAATSCKTANRKTKPTAKKKRAAAPKKRAKKK